MKRQQYLDLMRDLDAAVYNGYRDYVLSLTPEELRVDMLDNNCDELEDVPEEEARIAIGKWQERERSRS